MRTESEYVRCGTLAYLAACDVHRARVAGRCEPATGIKPFTALADQVMQTGPDAPARRVFWVAGNGASHRNWAAAERHYNATARPFDWKFTRTDLNKLLRRISRHDPFAPQPLAA